MPIVWQSLESPFLFLKKTPCGHCCVLYLPVGIIMDVLTALGDSSFQWRGTVGFVAPVCCFGSYFRHRFVRWRRDTQRICRGFREVQLGLDAGSVLRYQLGGGGGGGGGGGAWGGRGNGGGIVHHLSAHCVPVIIPEQELKIMEIRRCGQEHARNTGRRMHTQMYTHQRGLSLER